MEKKLVWIDLEMTGLDPCKDVILEIATIVTDSQCDSITYGPAIVVHQPEERLKAMDDWNYTQHKKSGLLDEVKSSSVSLGQAEEETMQFLRDHIAPEVAPLCGNSVWQDRLFLSRYMPQVNDFLHYRIIDVSTIKELVRRWYPDNKKSLYEKPDTHRAFRDILDSINELKHYRAYFFV